MEDCDIIMLLLYVDDMTIVGILYIVFQSLNPMSIFWYEEPSFFELFLETWSFLRWWLLLSHASWLCFLPSLSIRTDGYCNISTVIEVNARSTPWNGDYLIILLFIGSLICLTFTHPNLHMQFIWLLNPWLLLTTHLLSLYVFQVMSREYSSMVFISLP